MGAARSSLKRRAAGAFRRWVDAVPYSRLTQLRAPWARWAITWGQGAGTRNIARAGIAGRVQPRALGAVHPRPAVRRAGHAAFQHRVAAALRLLEATGPCSRLCESAPTPGVEGAALPARFRLAVPALAKTLRLARDCRAAVGDAHRRAVAARVMSG
jgi:hypothetical protein